MLLYRKKIIRKVKRSKQRKTNVNDIIFVDHSFTYKPNSFAQHILPCKQCQSTYVQLLTFCKNLVYVLNIASWFFFLVYNARQAFIFSSRQFCWSLGANLRLCRMPKRTVVWFSLNQQREFLICIGLISFWKF